MSFQQFVDPPPSTRLDHRSPTMNQVPHIRFETHCLFCGKIWSVQLGSPRLNCSCGANIHCLKDLTTKAAQDLEEKVFNVLMDTWQEKMGEIRQRQQLATSVPEPASSFPPTSAVEGAQEVVVVEDEKEIDPANKKTIVIVQCPSCEVNVIVPDVLMFQCGSCGQYMTVEKHGDKEPTKDLEISSLTNLLPKTLQPVL